MNIDQPAGNNSEELKTALQTFQSARLNRTYEDLKHTPEYGDMGEFFFNKLYSPDDFTFRNESIEKLHKALDGKVYAGMVTAVSKVIELHHLSDELDDKMVLKMIELGVGTDMNMEEYQKVYRSLDNYDQRLYQINLSAVVTLLFYNLSKKRVVAVSLKLVKAAAFFFNIQKIIDFVFDGYNAFKKIDNIDFFVDTLLEREIAWHNEIWEKADYDK